MKLFKIIDLMGWTEIPIKVIEMINGKENVIYNGTATDFLFPEDKVVEKLYKRKLICYQTNNDGSIDYYVKGRKWYVK